MSDLQTAAQQALEALEGWKDDAPSQWTTRDEKTITALRAALEQPEQEPVVTKVSANGSFLHPAWEEVPIGASLYAHPPRREWKGLTDEGLAELARQEELLLICDDFDALKEIARAIEAVLKERNA